MNRIITIGREFGSGGREIGRRIAENLHIAYYDQEIVTELSSRSSLTEGYIRNVEENHPLPLLPITTARTFGLSSNQAAEQQLSVYDLESRIIRDMASKSDCVIVGRCGDYVLRDMEPFRLFIYADIESKLARCRRKGSDAKELSDRELRRRITSIDKKRARYYNFFTDQTWGDKTNYDLCVNTSLTDIKKLAATLTQYLENLL